MTDFEEERRQATIGEVLKANEAGIQDSDAIYWCIRNQTQVHAATRLPAACLGTAFAPERIEQWPTRPLGEVAEVTGGVTLGRNFRSRATRLVHYLTVANVKDGKLDLTTVKQTQATEDEIESCRLRFGDVLLTEGGDPDKLGRGTIRVEQGDGPATEHV